VRVPAFTAYLEPDPDGARVSQRSGISDWTDPSLKVIWFGDIQSPGQLNCSLLLRLPADAETKLRLTAAGKSREAAAKGTGSDSVKVDFGSFDIPAAGYQQFTLESLNAPGQSAGNLQTLLLDGPAAVGAQFNLEERRNAASVHLAYPIAGATNVDAFYCEVTGQETPLWTYFEACGWHRGYFGMQVNSPTERRIIFSVWDSGNEGVDRKKVGAQDRVPLVAKGDGVFSGDFGNEGTGGHSRLVYPWKTGEKQRFIVTAKPTEATHTICAGYWFQPDQKKWMLTSSWKAPKDGGYLRGLYSFVENFAAATGRFGARPFTATNGFAPPAARGRNRPPRPSATIRRAKRIGWIVSWVSRTDSFFFPRADSSLDPRNTARSSPVRPTAIHPRILFRRRIPRNSKYSVLEAVEHSCAGVRGIAVLAA